MKTEISHIYNVWTRVIDAQCFWNDMMTCDWQR